MTMRTAIDTRAKILMAFWHRSRRQAVPLIAGEAANKIGMSMSCTRYALAQLEADGWLSSEMHNGDVKARIYRLAPKGEAMVMKAVDARKTLASQREARITAPAYRQRPQDGRW